MMSAVQSASKIDIFTQLVFAMLEKAEAAIRMHCQDEDCYRLAEIADTRTSLHYCREHYWRKQDERANWGSLAMRDYRE